jgi:uncharacterized lipoprotein
LKTLYHALDEGTSGNDQKSLVDSPETTPPTAAQNETCYRSSVLLVVDHRFNVNLSVFGQNQGFYASRAIFSRYNKPSAEGCSIDRVEWLDEHPLAASGPLRGRRLFGIALARRPLSQISLPMTNKMLRKATFPRLAAVTACSVILTACSAFQLQDEATYQQARRTEALEVPPDLTAPGGGGIPEIAAGEATAEDIEGFETFKQLEQFEEYEQYRKWKEQSDVDEKLDFQAFVRAQQAARQAASSGAGVSIDTNFDQSRDIRISAGAEVSLEYVETALSAMDVTILERDPDKYRFVVALPEIKESSVFRPKADEFVVQLGRDDQDMIAALVDRAGVRVTNQPAADFMDRLAGQVRLAKIRSELDNRTQQTKQVRGTLRSDESGHAELDLPEDAQLVWSQLDYIIDQVGFTVLDRQPSELAFRIRYITDEQIPPERTGLAKLAFWKKDPTIEEGSDIYTVEVAEAETGSTIRVLDNAGGKSDIGDTILELIREKL